MRPNELRQNTYSNNMMKTESLQNREVQNDVLSCFFANCVTEILPIHVRIDNLYAHVWRNHCITRIEPRHGVQEVRVLQRGIDP